MFNGKFVTFYGGKLGYVQYGATYLIFSTLRIK